MFKYVLQLIIGLSILAFSALFAWYEGSTLMDRPWEWPYSTPFSSLLNREIVTGYEISRLDYFVYAAKYEPFFPVLMLLSAVYLVVVVGCYFINSQPNWGLFFWGLLGCLTLLVALSLQGAATTGGSIFFWVLLAVGVSSIGVTIFVYMTFFRWKAESA